MIFKVKLNIINNKTIISSSEEEVCCKCGQDNCDDDVHQCYKCDQYICIDCDRNEMGTYDYEGEIHTLCYACSPKRRINFKVKKNYYDKVKNQ